MGTNSCPRAALYTALSSPVYTLLASHLHPPTLSVKQHMRLQQSIILLHLILFFSHFLVPGSVRQIKLSYVSFRAHVKQLIASYSIVFAVDMQLKMHSLSTAVCYRQADSFHHHHHYH